MISVEQLNRMEELIGQKLCESEVERRRELAVLNRRISNIEELLGGVDRRLGVLKAHVDRLYELKER